MHSINESVDINHMPGLSLSDRVGEHVCEHYQLSVEKVAVMLPTFLNVLQDHIQNLDNALANDDIQAIGIVGHTLKGALLNLGLFDIADIARCLEMKRETDSREVDYAELAAQLREQLKEIL